MTKNFEQLGVSAFFTKRLEDRNIRDATDIQRKIIPHLAEGKSIFFASATGTGKTFAYLLPILGKIKETLHSDTEPSTLRNDTETEKACINSGMQKPHKKQETKNTRRDSGRISPCFLIIAPTLELCSQIFSELEFLLEGSVIRSSLAIGSINLERQIEKIKKTKPDIIVGNPGRLLVLTEKRIIKLNNLRFLVLDEADRLVSDEMSDETNRLCKLIMQSNSKPGKSLTIAACSATMNKKNREKLLNACGIKDIQFIESSDNEILRDRIEHWAIFSEKRRKDQTLRSLLSALKVKGSAKRQPSKKGKSRIKALVFTSRGDEAGFVLSHLQHHQVSAAGLFGKINKKPLSGQERMSALEKFRQGDVEVLVSTDLAARGLDIPGITHVIALDVPSDSEIYIHRCGRTARAGKRGTMVTIGDETQMHLLAAMEKKLKIRILPKELHYGQVTVPAPIED